VEKYFPVASIVEQSKREIWDQCHICHKLASCSK